MTTSLWRRTKSSRDEWRALQTKDSGSDAEHPIRCRRSGGTRRGDPYLLEGASSSSAALNSAESTELFSRAIL